MIDIQKKIRLWESGQQIRLIKMLNYYNGIQDITNMTKPPGKPNNHIVTNFAKNIVNNTVGYYLGMPVTYSTEDTALQENISDITKYNDDSFMNTQLGRDLSIFGFAAELLYVDNDNNIRYARINPITLYIGFSDDIEENILYAIRWYDVYDDDNAKTRYIEYYTDTDITYFSETGGRMIQTGIKPHYFGQVPVSVYKNNEECRGDYDGAVSLFDAYNVMQSESVNDYQKFADALLAVKNMLVDDETANEIRNKNILQLTGEGEASWLVKSVNDTYVENIKNRLEKDIYMTTSTVNMSDDNFANNASGVAIKYKLMCMENRVACTVRYFKKGLQRRFELICAILNLKGGHYDYTSIDITFVRNIPANIQETATLIQQLNGIVSKKTLISQLPFVEDADKELNQIEAEGDYNIIESDGKYE